MRRLIAAAALLAGCTQSLGGPSVHRYNVETIRALDAGEVRDVDAPCDAGDVVYTGGCWLQNSDEGTEVQASYPASIAGLNGWRCSVRSAKDGEARAFAFCMHVE